MIDFIDLICIHYTLSLFVYSGNEPLLVIPDTQELCRRLEEKIANLTRMGSNLQQENQGYFLKFMFTYNI